MARPKKIPDAEKVVDQTNSSIKRRLHHLTQLQLNNWLAPHFDVIAEEEEKRIRLLSSHLGAIDPKWGEVLSPIKGRQSTKVVSDDWRMDSWFVNHNTVRAAEPVFRFNNKTGKVTIEGTSDFNLETPEEVTNSFRMEQTVGRELAEWTSQFKSEGSTGFEWTDANLGRMCAISPLYRSCLHHRVKDFDLPIYKYGPRGLGDVKYMSPELVQALQVAANLEDTEEPF